MKKYLFDEPWHCWDRLWKAEDLSCSDPSSFFLNHFTKKILERFCKRVSKWNMGFQWPTHDSFMSHLGQLWSSYRQTKPIKPRWDLSKCLIEVVWAWYGLGRHLGGSMARLRTLTSGPPDGHFGPPNGHLEVQKQILFEWMKRNFSVAYDTFETGYGQLRT